MSTGPTLTTIAREAGVSVPTVSKVLNRREDVAEATRRRVSEVLTRRGYVRRGSADLPDRPARPLLDVVLTGLGSTYAATILRAAEQAAHSAHMEIVVSAVLEGSRRDQPGHGWLDRIADRGTSGILAVLADLTEKQRCWLAHYEIPFVLLDPITAPPPDAHSVAAANYTGARHAVEHLAALGHRRIAIITGRQGRMCSDERLAGYRAAMVDAGLTVDQAYVRSGDFREAGGCRAMRELLDQRPMPSAVFACSDEMALGVYRALAERGLRVPADVSVVGFDDLPEARWVTPALTTVRQPLDQIATKAVRTLIDLIHDRAEHPLHLELAAPLVVRASTAATRPGV
jgi:DNA-binding LacI/PurR family transcriptional regulator